MLRRLYEILLPQRALLGASFALLLLHSGCRLAQPWLVMLAIDRHLVAGQLDGFWVLASLFLGCAVVEAAARWLEQVALEAAGQRALLSLRMRVFAHLQRLPASFHDKTPIGRLVGRVTTDVEALHELFSSGVVTIVGDVVFLAAAIVVLTGLSVSLTGATMLMVPVLVLVTVLVRRRARAAYSVLRSKISELNGFLHEQVSGMPVVQMFGQQDRRARDLGLINGGVRSAQILSVRWESVLSAATEMLGSFTTALILWVGGGLAIGGLEGDAAAGLTLGTLFAFVDYMQKFFVPLNDLSMKYTVLQNGLVASQRIFELLDREPEPPDAPSSVEPADRAGHIELRGVTFGYEPGRSVLHDVSFEITPGERVALVGATGSGKSTILALLSRLYDPDEGAVLLDGVDLRAWPRADVRRRVGLVPQDAFLFHGTILDNVGLGASPDAALEAARRLHLDEVATRFAGGFDEEVAEHGKNLSAGERQLVAFARMLVRPPEVLLLDEATSNVDSHAEHLLQDAALQLMAGRTSLIVAHRLSTIRDADRILVLRKGRLAETGRHEDLLARRGTYWRLYQLQYADQE